jgi:hypothetical protein
MMNQSRMTSYGLEYLTATSLLYVTLNATNETLSRIPYNDRMKFKNIMDKGNDKKDHYGPSSARNERYRRHNTHTGKQPSQAHGRDAYQEKCHRRQ